MRAVTISIAVPVCQPVICTRAGPHREEPVRMLRVGRQARSSLL